MSARCIIVRDGRLLVQLSRRGDFYRLPGGRVRPDETIIQALKRELREELGISISDDIGLVYIVESFYKRRTGLVHEIGFYFLCHHNGDAAPREPHIRIEWLDPERLSNENFRPPALANLLRRDIENGFKLCPQYILSIDVE